MSLELPRVAILASGNRKTGGGGSTAEQTARDSLAEKVAFRVGVVICNNPENKVPEVYDRFHRLNQEFGLKGDDRIEVINIGANTHPEDQQQRGQTSVAESSAISRTLSIRGIGFVSMQGYNRILTNEFLAEWCWRPEYADVSGFEYRSGLYHPKARTANSHSAILPFTANTYGSDKHQLAIDLHREGLIDYTAMTWQLAAEQVDEGPIIYEIPIEILPDDDKDSLGERVKAIEREQTAIVIEHHLILRAQHIRAYEKLLAS